MTAALTIPLRCACQAGAWAGQAAQAAARCLLLGVALLLLLLPAAAAGRLQASVATAALLPAVDLLVRQTAGLQPASRTQQLLLLCRLPS